MATREFNVLKANIEVDLTGVADVEAQITSLNNSIARLAKSNKDINSLRNLFQNLVGSEPSLQKLNATLSDGAEQINIMAKKTKDLDVQMSAVSKNVDLATTRREFVELTDIVDLINVQFRDLSNKGTEGVSRLRREFSGLRSDLGNVKTQEGVDQLVLQFEDLSRRISRLKQRELSEANDAFNNFGKTTAAVVRNFAAIDKPAQLFSANTVAITDRMRGLGLLFSGSGQKLQGFRELLAGSSNSTNIFTQAIDRLIVRNNDLAANQSKITRELRDYSQEVIDSTVVLNRQAEQVRKTMGTQGRAVDDLIQQITRVNRSLTNIVTSSTQGKDVTAAIVNTQEQVRRLRAEYQVLLQQGIIKAGDESFELFQQLGQNIKATTREIDGLTSRSKVVSQEIREAKEQEKLRKAEAAKSTKEYEKMDKAAEQVTTEIGKSTKQSITFFNQLRNGRGQFTNIVQDVQKVESTLKGAFSSSFFGNFLGNLASDITGNFVARITDTIQQIPGILIKAASDAEETQNRFAAVFKETTPLAEEFVQTLSSTVGRDPFAIKDSISSFQSFFVGLGFSEEAALKFSETTQAASLDLASFNNLSDSDAQGRFLSALSGSSEVMDKFGINIKEAAIEQKLFELGINKSSAEASEQEKVIARLAIIMESMGAQGAIGDAINTSTSFANQSKRLQANLQELATDVGTKLLPAFAPFLRVANEIAERAFPAIVSAVESFASTIIPVAENVADLFAGRFEALPELVDPLFDSLEALVSTAASWGFSLVEELANGIYEAGDTILYEAIDYVTGLWASFMEPGSPPEQGPLSSIDTWGSGLIDTFVDGMGDADLSSLGDMLDPIREAFEGLEPELATASFQGVTTLIADLNTELNETGRLNESAFGQIETLLGSANRALSNSIRTSLQYRETQRDVANIEQQIIRARIQGQDTTALEAQLRAARERNRLAQRENAQTQDALELQQQLQRSQEQLADTESGRGTTQNREEQSLQEKFEEEKKLLDEQLRLGLITEEDHQEQLARLNRSFAEQAIRQQDQALAQQFATETRNLDSLIQARRDAEEQQAEAERESQERVREERQQRERADREARKLAEKKTAQEIYDSEIALLESKKAADIITEEEYARERLKIEEKFYQATIKEGKAASAENIANIKKYQEEVDRLKKTTSKKTAQEVYDFELETLNKQLSDGVITQEEYNKKRLKIEQDYYRNLAEEGQSSNQENIDNINKFQAAVEAAKNKNKSEGLGLDPDSITGDFLSGLEERFKNSMKDIGEESGISFGEGFEGFKTGMLERVKTGLNDLRNFINSNEGFGNILQLKFVADIIARINQIISGGGILGAILRFIIGPFKTILAPIIAVGAKIEDLLGRLLSPILKVIDHLGIFGVIIKKVFRGALAISGPLSILIHIWLEWDNIVKIFTATMQFFNDVWQNFTSRLGGQEATIARLTTLWEDFGRLFDNLKAVFNNFVEDILSGDFSGAFENLFSSLSEGTQVDINADFIVEQLKEIVTAGFDAVVEEIAQQLPEALKYITSLLPQPIQDFIAEQFGDFSGLGESLRNLGETIKTAFSEAFTFLKPFIDQFLADIQPLLIDMGTAFEEFKASLTDAFTEISTLFGTVLLPVLTELGIALGLVDEESGAFNITLGQVIGFIVSVGLVNILEKIKLGIQAITFVVRVASFAIEVMSKIVQLFMIFLTGFSAILTVVISVFQKWLPVLVELKDGIVTFVNDVIALFQYLYMTLVGASIIPDLINGMVALFTGFVVTIITIITQWITDMVLWFNNLSLQLLELVTLLVVTLVEKFTTFDTDVILKITTFVANFIAKITELQVGVIAMITQFILDVVAKFGELTSNLMAKGDEFVDIGSNLISSLLDGFENAWEGVRDWVSESVDWIQDQFEFDIDLPDFSGGGSGGSFIPGFATGAWRIPQDNMLARLHKGETVLPADIAENFRSLMDAVSSQGIGNQAALGFNIAQMNPNQEIINNNNTTVPTITIINQLSGQVNEQALRNINANTQDGVLKAWRSIGGG